jgi:hypothetical protein
MLMKFYQISGIKYFTGILVVILLLALGLMITVASGSAVARLLELSVRISPVAWMSVSY